jgi:predicted aspartyl protease
VEGANTTQGGASAGTRGIGATRIPSVAAYAVLLAVLALLYRFTSIGLDRVPDPAPCPPDLCASPGAAALAPARRSPRHLLVPVMLEDRPLQLLLDTGASATVIDARVAREIGLVEAARTIFGAVNDRYGLQHVLPVQRLLVAGHAYGDFDVAIVDMTGVRAGLGDEVAGVLGADVLGRQPCEIDFARPALLLGRSAPAFDRARAPGEADTEAPISAVGGGWFVRALAADREAFFLVDTGSNVSQVAEPLAAELDGRAGVVVETPGRVLDAAGARAPRLRTLRLPILAVGDVGRRDIDVTVGETSLLGADFFAGMHLRIDAPAGLLTLRTREGRP